ncbi:RB1-inducible coiled-coil protein 1 [Trichonephila inaurata madagascariensis]|uniref:RB1-inducible coiled-coil protein 1 n=1 Tax=Trichonephila inaurata madagascariensis TaxID=2747483 RepID=A0A8X6XRZ1_9ARAC|nr:RB1-inducible coiled-coil protein 1 [Trichonephila inaurata madagascariensis]
MMYSHSTDKDMSLYVFIVSTGTTLKFSVEFAVKKVLELKNAIAERKNIPVADQVLLCSGGEELKCDIIVGNYSGAGTDTNPIFLFHKGLFDPEKSHFDSLLSNAPIVTSLDLSIEDDVKGCASMIPSIQAITVKASLAQRFADYALKGKEECIALVRDQHLQQQGWAAVIANLDDIKDSVQKSFNHLTDLFAKFLENVPRFQEILRLALDDIALLAKVPVLPKLIDDVLSSEQESEVKHTLLTWFCTEPQYYLELLTEKCQAGIDVLNEDCLLSLKEEFFNVLKNADNPDIKEVKGIGDRLANLNKLIEDFDKHCNDQNEIKGIFSSDRMGYARDPNVLPDVCSTYQTQLELMLQNHKRLIHILERCSKAKRELSDSINRRIQYISCVESDIHKMQTKIHNFWKYMQSVMNQIDCLEQVLLAPQRYLKMCAEVCRRREFSSRYMKWATELSSQCQKLYESETNQRRDINKESKNMVDGLFPGMSDMPPAFAIECPQPFDQNLPEITREDLDWLKTCVPELSHLCEVLPPEPMPCISQAESDSAFSSNIPSSMKIVSHIFEGTDMCEKPVYEKGLSYKVAAPSTDLNSLHSEYASLPNEVFSLTSSPFEDSFLPNSGSESKTKRTRTSQASGLSVSAAIIEEKHSLSVDSDGEEFETLDHYSTSPLEITTHSLQETRLQSHPCPTTTSDATDYNIRRDQSLRVSKASSEGDVVSPVRDRLKSSDSLLASADFQGTEYYIDDSMPSSYTESNATSPLMRGNRLVKSHHVVLAEFQRQLEEKNEALTGNLSSLENSHSNILKVHAKISALQKFIQDLQKNFQHELSSLKASVKDDLCEGMSQASQVVENINSYMKKLHQQMLLEKEEAVRDAKKEFTSIENAYMHRLEIESQKLSDAEKQILKYEERLLEVQSSYEELKHEKEQLHNELQDKKEFLKKIMLEHELEFDSFKNQTKDKIEEQNNIINELKQDLANNTSEAEKAVSKMHRLEEEASILEEGYSSKLLEEQSKISELQKENEHLNHVIKRLQESKEITKNASELELKLKLAVNEKMEFMKELEEAQQNFNKLKAETERYRETALKELEDKLSMEHRTEMESLSSCYRSTVKALSAISGFESSEIESLSEMDLEKISVQNEEKLKTELETAVAEEHKRMEEILNEEISKREEEKKKLITKLQSEHEEALEKLKSRITAESQVSFNEAINRLSKEKEAVVEELRSRISVLEAKILAIKSHLTSISEDPIAIDESLMSQSDTGASCSSKVTQISEVVKLISKLKKDLEPLFEQTASMSQSCVGSVIPSESVKKASQYSSFESNNKISILTCNEGDLVLLCYEERHENFAVFHFGPFVHFLHSDSLQALNLKLPAGQSERWSLGVVVKKEFCVTKKPENRYKVSCGTKFYRVKVKPWDRDSALALHQLQRSTHMASPIYSSKPSISHSSSKDGDGAKGSSGNMSASAI